jgi:cytochrome c-type biogenesis protein CcmH/NrfG
LESLGKKQDALESYEKAVNLDPGFTPARLALLRLKTTLTSFDPRALKEIETLLLSLDPTHYPREYREALFLKLNLEIQGNQPEAVNTLKLLREVAPQDPRLPLLASQVPSQQPPPPPSPAIFPKESPLPTRTLKLTEKKESKKIPPSEELRQKAREQKAKGYLLPAKKTLEEALALTPNNDEILVDLGELSMELGDTARAGQLFVQAGKLNPKNPRVYLNLGSLYVIQGDRERARKAYELYLRYAPPDAPERPEVERSLRRLQTP